MTNDKNGIRSAWERNGPLIVREAISRSDCDAIIGSFQEGIRRKRSYHGLVDLGLRNCEFVECRDRDTQPQELVAEIEEHFQTKLSLIANQPRPFQDH